MLEIVEEKKPYSTHIWQLAVHGDLPQLAQIKHQHKVFLRFAGQPLSKRDVQRFVLHEGRFRFMAYNLVEADNAMVGLIAPSFSAEQACRERGGTDEEIDKYTRWRYVDDVSGEASNLWIVSFVKGAEAKRFSGAVHEINVPYKRAGITVQHPHHPMDGRVTAEVLW